MADGPGRTILVVEVAGPSIHWMEPRDLAFDGMSFAINGTGGPAAPSSRHPGGINALLADGSVRFLRQTIAPKSLRALLTVAGDDDVGEF
ncbi:MAG TPA: H-X9-DG-CTERM domain-containing protein [Isosphaeraceae bacterium]